MSESGPPVGPGAPPNPASAQAPKSCRRCQVACDRGVVSGKSVALSFVSMGADLNLPGEYSQVGAVRYYVGDPQVHSAVRPGPRHGTGVDRNRGYHDDP